MKKLKRGSVVLFVAAIALATIGCDKAAPSPQSDAHAQAPKLEKAPEPEPTSETAGPPTTLDELPEGVNAVQNEMRLLEGAMHTTLSLIANDQLEGIPAQIKKVHPARQLTMKAIEKGVYKPPVNPEDMDKFVALDDAFHDDLKGLLKASKTDDLQLATDSYKNLVQGCTNCHTQFRFPKGE